MATEATSARQKIEIGTSVAARVLGIHFTTIHKYRRMGKITGRRASKATHAPWLYDREEIYRLRNADANTVPARLHD